MAATTSNKPLPGTETVVKQEKLDDSHIEIGEIQTEGFPPFQGTFKFAEEEAAGPSEQIDEPPPKRARRAAATRKPVQMSPETDEEDDVEALEAVTKVEDESESEGEAGDDGTGEVDEPEPAFVDVPSASIVDDQPGPSGLGKDGVVPPFNLEESIKVEETLLPDVTHAISGENSFHFNEKTRIYECDICSSDYTQLNEIQHHMTREHLEIFGCPQCLQFFNNLILLSRHVRNKHTRTNMYYCPLCHEYSSKDAKKLKTHMKTHNVICEFCDAIFHQKNLLEEHKIGHLGEVFDCVVCNKEFDRFSSLTYHQIRHHKVLIYNPDYYCEPCKKFFVKKSVFRDHVMVIHTKKNYLCDVCGNRYNSTDKLKLHYRIHTGEKPYACNFCKKTFAKNEYKVMHELVHTGEKPFICTYCKKSFNQRSSLRLHVRIHTGERPYKCQFCTKGFISSGALSAHKKKPLNLEEYIKIEENLLPDVTHAVSGENSFHFNDKTRIYHCDICSLSFTQLNEIQIHMTRKHLEIFSCQQCKLLFSDSIVLSRHVRTEHTRTIGYSCPLCLDYSSEDIKKLRSHVNKHNIKCNFCEAIFHQKNVLEEHKIRHLGEVFDCIVCNQEFDRFSSLKSHQIAWHQALVYNPDLSCTPCNKFFEKKYQFRKHVKTTHRKKDFLCDVCGNKYTSPDQLNIHYRIHTGEKPYACGFCGKTFSRRENKTMHELIHTGEKRFVCKYCKRAFNQRSSWTLHVRLHTGERPYKCQFCTNVFISSEALSSHQKKPCVN